jgi:hypothetical protein
MNIELSSDRKEDLVESFRNLFGELGSPDSHVTVYLWKDKNGFYGLEAFSDTAESD